MPERAGLEALIEILEAMPVGLAFKAVSDDHGFSNGAWKAMDLPDPALALEHCAYDVEPDRRRARAELRDAQIERIGLRSGTLLIGRRRAPTGKTEEAMQKLIAASLTSSDPLQLIEAAVQVIAETSGVHWAVASRFVGDGGVEALAVIEGGQPAQTFSYHLYGTPCHAVSNSDGLCFFNNVVEEFPSESTLAELGVQSYVGMVYRVHGTALGHFFVMDTAPLSEQRRGEVETALRLVSLFVGARLELLQAREELASKCLEAQVDALTQLGNRRSFDQAIARVIENQRSGHLNDAVLIWLDVDGLKRVNDVEGHMAGDRLLQCLAHVMRATLRADDLCFRVGGDEFAILITANVYDADVWSRRAEAWAYSLRRNGFDAAGISYGVARLSETPGTAEAWIELADARMYADKSARQAQRSAALSLGS